MSHTARLSPFVDRTLPQTMGDFETANGRSKNITQSLSFLYYK
jgi:hypothetical protein